MALERPGFDFASRDYDNIRRDLLARASITVPEWTDRDNSDFAMMMVDMWAYMGDIMHYYIDRAAAEAFLTTATQRESVLAIANLFDYTPRNRTAATATVYVSNSSASSVSLPAGTTFSAVTDGGLFDFYSTTTTTIGASAGSVAVAVREGKLVASEQLTTGSSGQVGQRYTLSQANVLPSSVRVYVYENGTDPIEWTRVDDINTVASGINAFSVYVSANNETQVVFGNRLSGRVPPTGTKITSTYYTTSGLKGNIPSGKITSFKGTTPSGLFVSSSTSAIGGTDGETIDSLKVSVKSLLKAQTRAVTLQDFVDKATLVEGVNKAVAQWSPTTSGNAGGSVTVHALPYIESYSTGTGASTPVVITVDNVVAAMRGNIVAALQPQAMLGASVYAAATITTIPKAIMATVTIEDNYVSVSVKALVENAILNLFGLENVKFGQDLNPGMVYKAIHDIPGVLYSTVTITGSTPTAIQLIRNNAITVTIVGGISTT
jgi:hypothetical protein